MYRLIMLCIFLVVTLKSLAQTVCTATLKGIVLDANTGTVVSDAVVIIKEQQKGDHSNEKGEYLISSLCTGQYTLVCKHLNHESKEEQILLQEGSNVRRIYLTCHSDTLHDLSIKAARIHWEDVTVSHKLQNEELRASQGLSLGKTLEKINGVYTLNTGSNISKPVIRGMHSNRVLVINNGIRQEGQQWGNEHAPEIDPSIAQSIEVIKGAQTIQYGSDIMGGLILVNPKPMQDVNTLQGTWHSGFFSNGRLFSSNLNIENRLKKLPGLAWSAHASYKRGGNIRTPDYFLKNTGIQEANYALGLGYQRKKLTLDIFHSAFFSTLGIFSGSHIGNLTDLYSAFERSRPLDSSYFNYAIAFPKQAIQHYLVKTSLHYTLNALSTLHLVYGYQTNLRKEYDKNLLLKNNDGSYAPVLSFELNTHNVEAAIEHKEIRHINGRIGFNGFYQLNNYYGNYFIPNYRRFQGGMYWVEKWHHNGWSVEGGLRYDANYFRIYKWEKQQLISPDFFYRNWAATLAARYQLPYVTFHLNLGRSWRAPFVNELFSYGVHHNAATFEIGDKNLVPERGYNASLTLDFNYHRKVDMELSVFYNHIKNYITLQPQLPATLTIRGAFPTMIFSQTDALFYGVEWAGTWHFAKRFQVHAKANTLYVRDIRNAKYLTGMPPARAELSADYLLYETKSLKLEGSGAVSYTFQQQRVEENSDYVAPPAAYTLAHAELHLTSTLHSREIHGYIGANNLLNTRYRDYLNRNRYFADEPGRNVFVKLSVPLFKSQLKK